MCGCWLQNGERETRERSVKEARGRVERDPAGGDCRTCGRLPHLVRKASTNSRCNANATTPVTMTASHGFMLGPPEAGPF